MKPYKHCPWCGSLLIIGEDMLRACPKFLLCGFVHWDNPVPVVGALIPHQGCIVLVRRKNAPYAGEWCLPGGYVNKGEDHEQAVVREVAEETGLRLEVARYLQSTNPRPHDVNNTVTIYRGRVIGGKLQAGDDALEVRLFKLEYLPDICFSSHQAVINNYAAGHYGPHGVPRSLVRWWRSAVTLFWDL